MPVADFLNSPTCRPARDDDTDNPDNTDGEYYIAVPEYVAELFDEIELAKDPPEILRGPSNRFGTIT